MENKEDTVRRIARRVVTKYNLVPPIMFENIFYDREIIYREENLGTNGDGYSDLKDSKLKIVVNSEVKYEPRKRFTIAHELGHIFIGWHNDVTLCETDNEYAEHNMLDIQEKEANIFASEILMPYDWIKNKLSEYQNLDLGQLINKLSSQAKTSIMAVLYALENAMETGNVIMVANENYYFPKKFVTYSTCEIYLRNTDFKGVCELFAQESEEFKIANYMITHYKFVPCPSDCDVKRIYSATKNLFLTLKILSNNSVFNILHCIKSILVAIPDTYFVKLYYKKENILYCKSEGAELIMPYEGEMEDLIEICEKYRYSYQNQDLGRGFSLFIIKEPEYKDTGEWKKSKISSKDLLNRILNEIYDQADINGKRCSINGIVGGANSVNRDATEEKLYDIFQKRMRREELDEFVTHRKFNEFISLKCHELMINKK